MNQQLSLRPVPPSWFRQPTLQLARSLLGMLLVHESEAGIAAGWIVETEGYKGPGDRAAHSFGGRRTARTEIMFGEPGYAYTYVMHTHCLLNVVSGETDQPEAVLIRALEPCLGIELMTARRGPGKGSRHLTGGPGKLTKALGITKADYGKRLWEPPLYIAEGRPPAAISAGPRIGIEGSGEARAYPWRYWETGNPHISR